MLVVTTPLSGWPDSSLREKLTRLLADRNDLQLVSDSKTASMQQQLEGRFNRQELIADGQTQKYRYVVWCDVIKQKLDVVKGFSLPFLMNQRRVAATLEMDYHIVDCYRGRLVASDKVSLRRNGPSTLQCLEDTDADPNLQMTYSEKKEIFDKMEIDASSKLMRVFDDIIRQR